MGENRDRNRNIPSFMSVIALAPSVFVVSFAFSFVGLLYSEKIESIDVPFWMIIPVCLAFYVSIVLMLSASFALYYESRSDSSEAKSDIKNGKADYVVGFVAVLVGVVVGSVVTAFGISFVLIPIIFVSVFFPSVQDLIMYLYIFALPLFHSISVVVFSVSLIHLCFAVGVPSRLEME